MFSLWQNLATVHPLARYRSIRRAHAARFWSSNRLAISQSSPVNSRQTKLSRKNHTPQKWPATATQGMAVVGAYAHSAFSAVQIDNDAIQNSEGQR